MIVSRNMRLGDLFSLGYESICWDNRVGLGSIASMCGEGSLK